MALNEIFSRISKIFKSKKNKEYPLKVENWNYFFYLPLIIVFFIIFIAISNLVNKKNKMESENLSSVIKSQEFSNLKNYFISKINSPYREVQYLIQNNDSIDRILKKLEVNSNDIKIITNKLKKKKTY